MRRRGCRFPQHQIIGVVARLLDQRNIAVEIREAQQRRAGLARAQKFTGTANEKILARDLEAVVRLVDHLEPRLGGVGQRLLEQRR